MRLYRFAAPASPAWNLARSLLAVACLWALFLVALPAAITRWQHAIKAHFLFVTPQPQLAVVVALIASAATLWGIATLAIDGRGTPLPWAAPRRLVITGPYAWLRNPLLVSGMVQGLAAAMFTGALLVVPCVALGGLLWQAFIRPVEDRELTRAFGRGYEAYRRNVRHWLPMRRPWTPTERLGPITLDELPPDYLNRRRVRE
jgi:protein-S-isoprenylcysteine O-methyltransferase Ste14